MLGNAQQKAIHHAHQLRHAAREVSRHDPNLANRLAQLAAQHQQDANDNVPGLTGNVDPGEDLWADYYMYPINFGSIVAGATTNATVQVMADSQFEWMRATVQGNIHGGSEPFSDSTLVPITIFITDTGSGRQIMQQALPVNLIAGSGRLPFMNPEDRIFQPSATIQVTAVSYGASQYDNIWFCFQGRKIFKGRAPVNG